MDKNTLKQAAATAALDYITDDAIIGVGTGSTANFFIDALAGIKSRIGATVASSEASAARLRGHGIEVLELNQVAGLSLYVDGADEVNPYREMIKGGGGALTREKIVASCARRFVCIVDDSKWVKHLGHFPLPVEVIPMARSAIARKLAALGGNPQWREGFVTDNGNHILDVHGLAIDNPIEMEGVINNWPGVVTNGLFAKRAADIVLVATADGVKTYKLD